MLVLEASVSFYGDWITYAEAQDLAKATVQEEQEAMDATVQVVPDTMLRRDENERAPKVKELLTSASEPAATRFAGTLTE